MLDGMTGWNDRDLHDLTDLCERSKHLEREMEALVSRLRDAGCPWSLIGDALGITRQAAQQHYGS